RPPGAGSKGGRAGGRGAWTAVFVRAPARGASGVRRGAGGVAREARRRGAPLRAGPPARVELPLQAHARAGRGIRVTPQEPAPGAARAGGAGARGAVSRGGRGAGGAPRAPLRGSGRRRARGGVLPAGGRTGGAVGARGGDPTSAEGNYAARFLVREHRQGRPRGLPAARPRDLANR